MVDAGVDMVVAEARIRYLAALRFDDEVVIEAAITRLGETSMTTGITLLRDGERVVEGQLRHVFIETGGGPPAAVPEPIREGLSAYEAGAGG
jgi:acyl-CoA thioester hydrolase